MKILAIETATIAGSVAIVDSSKGLIGEVRTDIKVAHSERLMPSVRWLLESSGISIHEIDGFAVSIGPGSFTGLRIGLSTAKGFAYASGKPLIPVPTLDAFARTLPYCKDIICPMLDARKNEIYAALYKWDRDVCKKIMSEVAISPEELLNRIEDPVVMIGDGANSYRELIKEALDGRVMFGPRSAMSPTASTVAEIAFEKIDAGVTTDPVSLAPFYLRKSEAELKWKK